MAEKPEKAKEEFKIIPKPRVRAPAWVNFLLYLCLMLLVVLFGAFLLLRNQTSALTQKSDNLNVQIRELESRTQQVIAQEVLRFSKKLGDFSILFKQKKEVSRIFEFFRSLCHSRTQFSSVRVESGGNLVILGGRTEGFQSLGEQLVILRSNEYVERMELLGISFDQKGKIQFELNITLSETFFEK